MLIPQTIRPRPGRPASTPADRALLRAACEGQVGTIRFLVRGGTGIDLRDEMGRTALHVAALHGQVGAMEALLDFGADPNARDGIGASPIDWARACGQRLATQLLRLWGSRRARGSAARRQVRAGAARKPA